MRTTLSLCLLISTVLSAPTGLTAQTQSLPKSAPLSDPLAGCTLPPRFTITYTVYSKDLRTEAMRQSEMQAYLDYWRREVQAGHIQATELPRLEASTREEYQAATPSAEYTLTLSSDGSRLLCKCQSKAGDDLTIGMYDSVRKQTEFLEISPWTNGRPETETLPGFNYARLRLIPLLPFHSEKLGLFFLKERAPAIWQAVPGSRMTLFTLSGKNPVTFDAHGVRIKEIPYQPARVTLREYLSSYALFQAVGYDADQKEVTNDWHYSLPDLPLPGTPYMDLPATITHRDYKGFLLDGKRQNLPKTEYVYRLVKAQPKPLVSARFAVETWLAERKQAADAQKKNVDMAVQSPLYTQPAPAQLASGGAQRHDLTGTVTDADGKPLPDATVYVYEAAQRVGTSPFCPSCYLDCGKREVSKSDGSFQIPSLAASLIFRLLVLREGYAPSFVNGVDPLRGKVNVALAALPKTPADPKYMVNGLVVDPDGKPVIGATVELVGLKDHDETMFGEIPGMEPLTITNARGAFAFHCPKPESAIYVLIKARGLAPKTVSGLSCGTPQPHRIALATGATVAGTVQDANGHKLAGVTVEIVPVDRNTETFVGWFTIGTNAEGRYSLPNLPAGQKYAVCVRMEGLASQNLGGPRGFVTPDKDGATTDDVNLMVNPAAVVTGRVVLADGKPFPPNTRLMLGRDGTWDVQQAVLAADGSFTFRGVPQEEEMSLNIYVSGYHTSETTPGYNKVWHEVRLHLPQGTAQKTDVMLTLTPDKPDRTASR